MDTSRYRAFLLAVESGSIKGAADIMGYTPSAVSQLVHSLESELGIILFHRGKSGVSLTSQGEMIFPLIKQVTDSEDYMLQKAAELNGTVLGTVNIAAYQSLLNLWMPDIISSFQKKYPQVRINLYAGTQKELKERLLDGKADLVFFNDASMDRQYDWIPLFKDPMMAVVPAGHPMANEKVFPLSRYSEERFIMPEHGYDYDVMAILGGAGVKPDVYLSTFDSALLLNMVGRGLGVSMVNKMCFEGKDQSLFRAIPLEPERNIELGIALLSIKKSAPAVRKFAEYAAGIITGGRSGKI